MIAEKAKEKEETRKTTFQKSEKSNMPEVNTTKELAKVAGVSHDTIAKVEKIEQKATSLLVFVNSHKLVKKKSEEYKKTAFCEFTESDKRTMQEQSRNADILNTSIYAAVMPENSRCMRFMAWGYITIPLTDKTPVRACIRLLWLHSCLW